MPAVIKCGPFTARKITVNITEGESYDFLPGGQDAPPAEVPNYVVDHHFVKALVENGSLIVVSNEPDVDADDGLDLLRAQAEALGIKVDKRWKAEKLQAAIEEATNKE